MSVTAMSMIFLLIGAFIWVIFSLFLNGKSYYKNVLAGIMITSVVFVLIPLPENIKNNIIYPLLGGFFVGELILGWIRKIKRRFISETEENKLKKPSKLTRKENIPSDNKNKSITKEQVVVSDVEMAKRKRVVKRYDSE